MCTFSSEHKNFLKKKKREKILVITIQLAIIIFFIGIWEFLAQIGAINTFLFSSPHKMVNTLVSLYQGNTLFNHIWITLYETILSFSIATLIGFVVATLLWYYPILSKILDPYLTVINSLPKVALGPLIIIWFGANMNSIIWMALFISAIITIINMYNGFCSTDTNYITLLRSFKAKKWQIFVKAILPSNTLTLINSLKINVSMSLIGVIMGELLVSKEGLGYLIMYGSQVFNINLVITSVFILGILSYFMYYLISYIEKKLSKRI